jgi:hypothetical protein
MTLEPDDIRQLLRLLERHPEWRAELRRLVLTEALLRLPDLTRDLADIVGQMALVQRQAFERLERLEAAQQRTADTLLDLAQAQTRTDQCLGHLTARIENLSLRLEQLIARVDDLTQPMVQVEERIVQLTARVDELTMQMSLLAAAVQRMADHVGRLKGWGLEERVRWMVHALFPKVLRRPRLLEEEQFAQLVEDAEDQGVLAPDAANRLIEADLIVTGRRQDDRREVCLVVEVSAGIGVDDVPRVRERAELGRRLGLPAVPAGAGTWVTPGAEPLLEDDGAVVVLICPDDRLA